MQDLGGCRAIVGTTKHVNALVKKYERSDLKHVLDDVDDYIANPKPSGYRSIHLIYKYFSDKKTPAIYNGLFIEVQIRSRLQHAWATAVETVGTFLRQSLKSSQGEEQWLRFFALMGSALAIREGSSSLVPNTPTSQKELTKELRKYARDLNVANSLRMYGQALNVGRQGAEKGNQFYLMKLEPKKGSMTITGFRRKDLEEAAARYIEVEKEISDVDGSEAVLVSVDSLAALQRAYPNYFLDTDVFLGALEQAIKS